MTESLQERIEKLRELEKAATPGPWDAYEGKRNDTGEYQAFVQKRDAATEFGGIVLIAELSKHDAKLVAHLRNHALAIIEEQQHDRQQWWKAMELVAGAIGVKYLSGADIAERILELRAKCESRKGRMTESLQERIDKLRDKHPHANPSTGDMLDALAIIEEQTERIAELEELLSHRSTKGRLSPKQVMEVRRMHRSGYSIADIAHEFGVTQGTISCITRRVTWKHLP